MRQSFVCERIVHCQRRLAAFSDFFRGCDKQAAILPLIGRLKMTILDMTLAENATPILIGRPSGLSPISIDRPQSATGACCWLKDMLTR